MQQLQAGIVRRMDEDQRGDELARKSLGGAAGTGSEGCSGTQPQTIWIPPHGKKYHNSSSCSALDNCPKDSKYHLYDLREAVITNLSSA